MVYRTYKKYGRCKLKELTNIRGIGDEMVKSLKKAGYKNVAQVYLDSTSSWGRLARIPGISKKTAANLFKEINKAKICK